MALAADQASAAWKAGPAYNPLIGMDAGSSWAAPVELPQTPGYDTLLPGEAGSSWHGAKVYQALAPAAAGAQWRAADTGGEDFTPYVPLLPLAVDASWLGAKAYQALQAGAADGQWSRKGGTTTPQPKPYAPLAVGAVDASWQGAKAYQPLQAGAADGQFAHPKPAAPVYLPLAAVSADASWLGALPYAALLAGSADAQWIEQDVVEPTGHVASSFMTTKFGTPERWIAPPTKVVQAQSWVSGGFGVPYMPQIAAPVSTGVRFGIPRATFNTDVGGGGYPVVAQARSWRSGVFGRPQAHLKLQVQQQPAVPLVQFGVATARLTMHAASMAPATKFGTPAANLHLKAQAQSWQATKFGTPLVMRQGNVQGFCTTQFGTPSSSARLAVQAQGFQTTKWGVHTMAITVHALPIAPGTRFGRPKRTWNIEC